jgi:transposase
LEKKLEPQLAEAKEGKRKVFFVDAAHFVMGSFLSYLWCLVRIFVPSSSGRKRYNVLGAIDAISHHLFTICNETYINAISVCELLQKIKDETVSGIPITLVMDNAKYQKCSLVKELAYTLDIELLFLPSYSPNLNLIERLWRWIRKDCLNNTYYEHFSEFKEAINQSLQKISKSENKEEMNTLLTLKFQLFENANCDRG